MAEAKNMIQKNIRLINVNMFLYADFGGVEFNAPRRYMNSTNEVTEEDFFVK